MTSHLRLIAILHSARSVVADMSTRHEQGIWRRDVVTCCRQGWAAMPRRARDALKKADLQLVDTLEHRMLTALAEAEASAVRLTDVSAEVPT